MNLFSVEYEYFVVLESQIIWRATTKSVVGYYFYRDMIVSHFFVGQTRD